MGFELMTADATSSTYTLEVALKWKGNYEFKIVRNKDWEQMFYPPFPSVPVDEGDESEIYGPDDEGFDRNWCIKGQGTESFKIEFQRTPGSDSMRVAWRKI